MAKFGDFCQNSRRPAFADGVKWQDEGIGIRQFRKLIARGGQKLGRPRRRKAPGAKAIRRCVGENRKRHRKLGRPRRQKIPIATSIGPGFGGKSHMASETRGSRHLNIPIEIARGPPMFAQNGDFCQNSRRPAVADGVKWTDGGIGIRHFRKLIARGGRKLGRPRHQKSQSRKL